MAASGSGDGSSHATVLSFAGFEIDQSRRGHHDARGVLQGFGRTRRRDRFERDDHRVAETE